MAYLALSFELDGLDPQRTEACCFESGALSVTFSDAHEAIGAQQGWSAHRGGSHTVLEPKPGEVRLWANTRVQALYPAECADAALLSTLATALGIEPAQLQASALAERVWEREWLRDFHATRFGRRLWVCPRHEAVTQNDAVVVRLDPGLAFGTGTHPSTAMCLEWLDAAELDGCTVIDYGSGSGVLGIAALKLGARQSYALDIDPQALQATRENALGNGVEERLQLCERPAQLPASAQVLLANILSTTLVALSAQLAALVAPGGWLLLAGILEEQESEVAACYAAWFDIQCQARCAGWVNLQGRRR
jgi:ribosomal protein L11 methyltransferase